MLPEPDVGGSILPELLLTDSRTNCRTCPDCDEDPEDCYECDQAGQIVGGEITAAPTDQPEPGQTVCFDWTDFTVEGRKRKCKADCGDEGTVCPVEMTLGASWVIEKKKQDAGALCRSR